MWPGQLAFDELDGSDDVDDLDSDDLESVEFDEEESELDEEPSVAEVLDDAPRVSVT